MGKNKSDVRVIFVDIDGTLYDHQHKRFDKSGIKALKKARKNGVKVIISSGRPYRSIEMLGTFKRVPYDGYVCANGGIAFVDNHYCLKHLIKPEYVNKIIEIAHKRHLVLEIMGPTDAYLADYESDITDRFFKNWVESKPRIDSYKGEEVTSMLLFGHDECDKYFQKLPVYFYRFFNEGSDIYECKYTKDEGIKAVLNYYGFSKNEAMAIGDDIPDIDMFKEVKYSVAMGNAKDECKNEASFVTSLIHKKGIFKALKEYKII